MDIRARSDAVVVVDADWTAIPLVHAILAKDPIATGNYTTLFVTISGEVHSLHGLVIEVAECEGLPRKGVLFIPWRYICAVYWSPEMKDASPVKKKIGFDADLRSRADK